MTRGNRRENEKERSLTPMSAKVNHAAVAMAAARLLFPQSPT